MDTQQEFSGKHSMALSEFFPIFQRLAVLCGRYLKPEMAVGYYRYFKTLSRDDFQRVCDEAGKRCKSIPRVKILLEIADEVLGTRKHRERPTAERPITLHCECGTDNVVDMAKHTPSLRYGCTGSMAKGFRCGRVFDHDYIMKHHAKELELYNGSPRKLVKCR